MAIGFLTSSEKKFREAQAIIPSLEQIQIDLDEIQHEDPKFVIKKKLEQAKAYARGEFIVEDSGLYLECLNGWPGPFTRWFLSKVEHARLYDIAACFSNHYAEAKTVIGYLDDQGRDHYFEGSVRGLIVQPRGEFGFGWDPIFLPENATKTFAEMSFEEKNQLSMRRRALSEFRDFLAKKK